MHSHMTIYWHEWNMQHWIEAIELRIPVTDAEMPVTCFTVGLLSTTLNGKAQVPSQLQALLSIEPKAGSLYGMGRSNALPKSGGRLRSALPDRNRNLPVRE